MESTIPNTDFVCSCCGLLRVQKSRQSSADAKALPQTDVHVLRHKRRRLAIEVLQVGDLSAFCAHNIHSGVCHARTVHCLTDALENNHVGRRLHLPQPARFCNMDVLLWAVAWSRCTSRALCNLCSVVKNFPDAGGSGCRGIGS